MEIEVKTSIELTESDWDNYTSSFNQVFSRSFTVNDFKHKYLTTIDDFSYHVLLKSEGIVVGGFTIIPFEYLMGPEVIKVGFPLDVFILSDFRKDFLNFYRMYQKIKQEFITLNIDLIIITPNYDSYQYWKKVIKMKDIGLLKYYIFPVRVSNVFTILPGFINKFSILGLKLLIGFSRIFNFKENLLPIRINRSDEIVEKQRYTHLHNRVYLNNVFFSYRIVDEEGVFTCYLIDFYNLTSKLKDTTSLRKAIKYISTREVVDIILFIGKISFFQTLLFKVPFKFEPKHLYFMADIINQKKINNSKFIYDINNWDFGLFNYDVR